VTQVIAFDATSSSATLSYPPFSFDVMSSVFPSGESEDANVAALLFGVRFSARPLATSMR